MQHPVPSTLDGLWLLLVQQDSETTMEGRVPLMARAGDEQKYLLAFKNAPRARKFLETSNVPSSSAEPRLVVRSNKDELLRIARANGVVGVLVDYDPVSQAYSAASAL